MSSFEFIPKGVCSKKITFDITDGKLHNVNFSGGCPGNLKAISKLIEGADAKKISGLLKGNQCATRGTSCADQLAVAIENAIAV